MKNKLKSIFLLALSAGVLATSCSEDDHTGASMINYTSPTVTLSTASNDVVVDESMIDPDLGYNIAVTATIAEPVFADLHIPLVQTGGTADSDDFSAGTIIITAGHTSAMAYVTINRNGYAEGTDTLTIGEGDNIANANVSPFTLNVTINDDYINDLLELTFDWSGTYTYNAGIPAEVTIDFCDIDMDFPLADAAGNILGYIAGTADCPEHGELDGLADGTYIVIAELYDNPFAGLGTNQPLPITMSWHQEAFSDGELVSPGFNTEDTGGAIAVAYIEVVNGYNYTITPF
ncbi:hypothetical protein [Formosa maritima]|uniref:Uncharacterized protein n=1 Tax=Formosa maritima TaxID=2592046 RepID=A0A5D0G3M6_9FLAO|nr:hypothetical protein [Formosa maritima]TYA53271.1 hypothetical protein FVF61_11535 [Formosa maritima]